jgi:superfamily I DNA/RNA helicase
MGIGGVAAARTDALLQGRAVKAPEAADIAAQMLNNDTGSAADAASAETMHRAKILEFQVVVTIGCEAPALPAPAALKDLDDRADLGATREQERQLLYVATTRGSVCW